MSLIESERAKYEKVYQFPGYGSVGHGTKIAAYLLERAPTRGILGDFGCGRGGSFKPYIDAGFKIQPVDHVDALAPEWRDHPCVLPFAKANLWADTLPVVEYGMCTDVMEHIPEVHVDETIENIADAVGTGCLWSICHVPDVWGKRVNEVLHMTVKESEWWRKALALHWRTVSVLRAQPGVTIYWTAH